MIRCVNVCIDERTSPILCNPGEAALEAGDFCVIDRNGRELTGFVRGFVHESADPESDKVKSMPTVARRASPQEVRAWHFLKRRESEAIAVCKEKAAKHGLEMKVSNVEFDDRLRRVVFYFTADKRVDFRELVKDLAAAFRARIELWQIGVRDEAKRMGGIGLCGCPLCCAAWMKDFAPVSIRCAKAQDLQFSPTRLSGVCGRLRCCLSYEHEQYVEMGKDVPAAGCFVDTDRYGECKVIERNLLSRTLSVVDAKGQNHAISVADVRRVAKRAGGDKQGGPQWETPIDEEAGEDASILIAEDEEASARRVAAMPGNGAETAPPQVDAEPARGKTPPGARSPIPGEGPGKSRRRRRGRRRSHGDSAPAPVQNAAPPRESAPRPDNAPPGASADGDAKKERRPGRRRRRSKRKAGRETPDPAAP